MAPINLPDGSQVSEIVLPDGSTASEVLAPDGSTVFSGIPDGVVDNFEKAIYGDQGLTLVDYYNGGINGSDDPDLNFADRISAASNGSNLGLEIVGGSGSGVIMGSLDGDGLPEYPAAGDTFELFIQSPSSSSSIPSVGYGIKTVGQNKPGNGDTDGYFAKLQFSTGNFSFLVNSGGSSTTVNSKSVSLSTNEFYRIKITWSTNGNHTLELFDSGDNSLAQINETDSTYTSGGVACGMNNGSGNSSAVYFDEYKII